MPEHPSKSTLLDRARHSFERAFGRPPTALAAAPGRVNLIGEHTDYNDGLVLPIAIDAWCACAARINPEGVGTEALALDLNQRRALVGPRPARPGEHDAEGLSLQPGHWMSYVAGTLHTVTDGRDNLPPLQLAFTSSIPIGGGLSSSAALEVAVALAALNAWGLDVPPPLELARLCQRAEHEFAGVPCGLMDQCASILARAHHALRLDCRSLDHDHIPLGCDLSIVVVDTGVRHALASGQYTRRRQECQDACTLLCVASLRDATIQSLSRRAPSRADETPLRRARHVITENQRVDNLAAALRRRDLAAAGRLMLESHASLRDDFQVSCPELNRAVKSLAAMPGVYGSRMTGGGFGGCAIALARADHAQNVARQALELKLGVSAHVVHATVGACSHDA